VQDLADGVGVPGGARAGLKADAEETQAGWLRADDDFIDPYAAGEVVRGTFTAISLRTGDNFHNDLALLSIDDL
jgi:hypothetical protein